MKNKGAPRFDPQHHIKKEERAEDMGYRLRAFAALLGMWFLVGRNHLQLQYQGI